MDISNHNIDGAVQNVTFPVTEKDFQERSVCQSTIVKLMYYALVWGVIFIPPAPVVNWVFILVIPRVTR